MKFSNIPSSVLVTVLASNAFALPQVSVVQQNAVSNLGAKLNVRSADPATLPPPEHKVALEESEILKKFRKAHGAPEMKEGEWHAVVYTTKVVEEKKDVTTCHQSLVVGEIKKTEKKEEKHTKRAGNAENSALGLLSIEGKLFGFILKRAEKVVRTVVKDLVKEHAEKGQFSKYKGAVHKHYRDHQKIKQAAEEVIKIHKSTFEEKDCETIVEKLWEKISKEEVKG